MPASTQDLDEAFVVDVARDLAEGLAHLLVGTHGLHQDERECFEVGRLGARLVEVAAQLRPLIFGWRAGSSEQQALAATCAVAADNDVPCGQAAVISSRSSSCTTPSVAPEPHPRELCP